MGIAKRDALLLVAKMEGSVIDALNAWNKGDMAATFEFHKGYASALMESVALLVGENSDLHKYIHGRMSWLLSRTTMTRHMEGKGAQLFEGFLIRPVGVGHWYVVGVTPGGDVRTMEEAYAEVQRIRALFALPKLPAKEGK